MSRFSLDKRSIDFQFSKGTAYDNLSHMGIEIGTFLVDDDPDIIRKREPSGAHDGAPY
jgi:hypothetical protein